MLNAHWVICDTCQKMFFTPALMNAHTFPHKYDNQDEEPPKHWQDPVTGLSSNILYLDFKTFQVIFLILGGSLSSGWMLLVLLFLLILIIWKPVQCTFNMELIISNTKILMVRFISIFSPILNLPSTLSVKSNTKTSLSLQTVVVVSIFNFSRSITFLQTFIRTKLSWKARKSLLQLLSTAVGLWTLAVMCWNLFLLYQLFSASRILLKAIFRKCLISRSFKITVVRFLPWNGTILIQNLPRTEQVSNTVIFYFKEKMWRYVWISFNLYSKT